MSCSCGDNKCSSCPCDVPQIPRKRNVRHVMLAGNPNCGKSTLFNRLCNMRVRTGNYPGVTVMSHTGNYSDSVQMIDLPGIYSLTCSTAEEKIASEELLHHDPELIINIIDATCLERSLYLTSELKLLGIPMLVVLNMCDVAEERKIRIDADKLSSLLGTAVIPLSATSGKGIEQLNEFLNRSEWEMPSESYIGSERVAEILKEVAGTVPEEYRKDALHYAKSAVLDDPVPASLSGNRNFTEAVKDAKSKISSLGINGSSSVEVAIASDRYSRIDEIIDKTVTRDASEGNKTLSEKLDIVLLGRYTSIPVFVAVMFFVYFISVSWIGSIVTDWTNDTFFGEMIIPWTQEFLTEHGTSEILSSLITAGIIGGVGTVLGFVPQMIILFLFLSLLEECGYMTRAAFILDRIFQWFGLSGRAFIPYLIGSGCGVPALMTARTLGSESERRIALFTATMIPCSAKLPVIITFANCLFSSVPLFAPMMYFLSIAVIISSATIFKKFSAFKSSGSSFLLELPSYHLPNAKVVIRTVYGRIKAFVIKAGTVIFASVTLVWFMSTFSFEFENGFFKEAENIDNSMLRTVSEPVAPIFAPLGFSDYKAVVPVVAGLVAKENIITTLAVTAGVSQSADDEVDDDTMAAALDTHIFHNDKLAAFSFVMFNLFTLPCFAAIGVLRRELNNKRLFRLAVSYQLGFAYALAAIFYNFAMWFKFGVFSGFTVLAIVFAALILFLLLRKGADHDDSIKFEMVFNK